MDRGEVASAVTQLTHLLAEDFGYPGARARLQALAPRLPAKQPPTTGPLTLPPSRLDGGLQEGLPAPAAPTLLGLREGPGARYQLLRELGCGSAGAVYLAYDTQLHCELALKVFHPRQPAAADPHGPTLLRALHEARLLAAVRHPGVIALYELAGEPPDPPPPRLAMELCRGGSLRARLRQGPLPVQAALLRASELLDTLAAVHSIGMVHGDIKPENLLFRGPGLHRRELPPAEALLGDLVLSDFGLAQLGQPAALQGAQQGFGTLGYSAPERLTGAPAEPASDLYATGVVLLEMLGLYAEPKAARALVLQGGSPLDQLSEERWDAVSVALGPPAGALRALLRQLLAPDPPLRPTAEEALLRLFALTTARSEGPDDDD
jgi:serine/threonine protein kinase